jgi:hypothetical protein
MERGMFMNNLLRRLAGAMLLLAALGITACPFMPSKDDTKPQPVKDFWDRTSPSSLLHNLKKAYEKRSIAEYESLLAKDFTFVLSAEDQQQQGMPDSWGRAPEIQIHTRMFDAELVQTLTLAFEVADSVWDPADGMYTALMSNVNLYLVGATPAHPGDVKEYRVSGGRAKFWFRKNPWTVAGKPDSVWTIVKWEDSPIGG